MENPQEIKQEVRRYLMLFPVLLLMTFANVAISFLHLGKSLTIGLILTIAAIQGTIATCFFMHLINEKQFTRILLACTAVFFMVMFWLFIAGRYDIPQGGNYVP